MKVQFGPKIITVRFWTLGAEAVVLLRAFVERAFAPAANRLHPDGPLTDEYWRSILDDQRARGGGIPIQNRRLSEIPRHVLRVSCRRCDRIVEIQTADAIRLFGAHAIWKDVGNRLLDDGCQQRTGNRDSDGCWPSFASR